MSSSRSRSNRNLKNISASWILLKIISNSWTGSIRKQSLKINSSPTPCYRCKRYPKHPGSWVVKTHHRSAEMSILRWSSNRKLKKQNSITNLVMLKTSSTNPSFKIWALNTKSQIKTQACNTASLTSTNVLGKKNKISSITKCSLRTKTTRVIIQYKTHCFHR